ncbi:UMP kinase [Haloarcula marina]|uniref:UMP kinase n=1 Tax=Haloarcula marina TaxID=2961574 RepID=UPI0020B7C376|nr:UMP kinase [Halomicroarcula marina]
MKVVVSVGGSVLAPDLEPDRVADYAAAVQSLDEAGHTLGAVVGGGPTAREYIGTARELGANEIELDQLGIAVTRLNARLLIAALGGRAASPPAESYDEGRQAIRRGDIPVLGGIVAAQTTDAVAAAFAEYVDADLLVYATSVDGVYDADPKQDGDATRFDQLPAGELVDIIADMEMDAGSNAPVDLLAAKVIQRSGIRTVVLDGTDPNRLVRAVEDGEFDGTEITPEG